VELLKIIGEQGINITPRVMMVGGNGTQTGESMETTALIGTMLDTMIDRTPEVPQRRTASNTGNDSDS